MFTNPVGYFVRTRREQWRAAATLVALTASLAAIAPANDGALDEETVLLLAGAGGAENQDFVRCSDGLTVKRRQLARINEELCRLRAAPPVRIRLNLFDDASLQCEAEYFDVRSDREFGLRCRLPDVPHGRAILIVRGEIVVGTVFAPGIGLFEIRTTEGDRCEVREIDVSAPDSRVCGADHPEATRAAQRVSRGGFCPTSITSFSGYAADAASEADLMVYYTPAALAAAGSVPQLEALVDLAVAIANTAYIDSAIDVQIRVIRIAPIHYIESPDAIENLLRLADPGDGILDVVFPERDAYGGDLVSLWVGNVINAGGAAFYPNDLWPNENGLGGFSVLRIDNAPFETLAHEIGHNFGCQHDRLTNPTGGWYDFSYGYREPGNAWKTIMAYPPGATVPYFSNPSLTYTGPLGNPGPLGVPGKDQEISCDNARTHNLNAFTIANMRPSTVEAPPPRIYVNAAAPPGGDGSSWANAMKDVQDAIGLAVRARGAVSEIWTAAGVYRPDLGTGDRRRSFRLANGVALYGGFSGTETMLSQRDPLANPTVLTGDIGAPHDLSDNTYHVINGDNLDATAVLDGFVIRDGNADGTTWPDNFGGGGRVFCGSPTFRNCRFEENYADFGGGGLLLADGSDVRLEGCTFENNTAFVGGAIHVEFADATISDCDFIGNHAAYGGAIEQYLASPTYANCLFEQNSAQYAGGAIHCDFSSPTFDHCMMIANTSDFGAGMRSFGSFDGNGPVFTGCLFEGNAAYAGGGARLDTNSFASFIACDFIGNFADFGAGADSIDSDSSFSMCWFEANLNPSEGFGVGGGLSATAPGSLMLADCTFIGNFSGFGAGGLGVFGMLTAVITRCDFIGNSTWYGGGAWNDDAADATYRECGFFGNTGRYGAGGMHNSDGTSPMLINCVFSGNRAPEGIGGGIWNIGASNPVLIHCTLAGNSGAFGGGGIWDDNSGTDLRNCIAWNNAPDQLTGNSATTSAAYSNIQGGFAGAGNLNVNPQFTNPNGTDGIPGTLDDDLSLASPSPCIDAGNNILTPGDVTVDFAGNPRFVDDPAHPNTGVVDARPPVDIGAYERGLLLTPGDMNCDGIVTPGDIAGFVLALTNPAQYAAQFPNCNALNADVNGDGVVSPGDIAGFVSLLTGG